MKQGFLVLVLTAICSLGFSTAFAGRAATYSEWDDFGIQVHKSDDEQFEMRMDVRMYLDATCFINNKNEMRNGTMLRRARLALKTRLWEIWEAEWDMDFADNVVEVKDMWVSYMTSTHSFIKAGHFKVPFSLEKVTSSRLITFMERSCPNVFPPGRRAALGGTIWFDKLFLSSAVYGQEFGDKEQERISESFGLAARAVCLPILDDEKAVHLGGGFVYQTPDDESEMLEYKTVPEAYMGDTEFVGTGVIHDVDHFVLFGIEGAASYKNIYVQGEYIRNNISRLNDGRDLSFYGGYVFAGFILTGQHRPYEIREGEFGKILPEERSKGALEVVVRYSHICLSDYDIVEDPNVPGKEIYGPDPIFGGKANNYTLGFNWYANPNVKVVTNYMYVDNSIWSGINGGLEGDDDFGIIQTRILVNF